MTRAAPAPVSVPVPEESVHRWVAAALVDVGQGAHDERAERAARTGRYIVPAGAWIEVLEVYCARCRAPYSPRAAALDCRGNRSDRRYDDLPLDVAW